MVERAANYLLSLDGLNRVVGPHWTRQFLDRYPEYFKRKQKPLAVEQKNAPNLKDMEEYFETFRKLVEWFGLAPEDMWNMRFKISCGKAQWIITNDASKALIMTDPDNQKYITSTKSINGVGHTISAFFILQGKHTLHKWAFYNNLSNEISLNTSNFRYSNDNLTMN